MVLADSVHITRRFQRSIRIDADHDDLTALEGFVCPMSSAEVLAAVAKHVSETGHGAFTWTGPYGSGKSSLVIALSALLSAKRNLVAKAVAAVGKSTANEVLDALPPKTKGWLTIPVVGRRDEAARVIGEAIQSTGLLKRMRRKQWTDESVVSAIIELAGRHPRSGGGVILFIDEMGKFLEAAAQEGADVYLFQLLAEAASRSSGRLIIIGVLHQAFEEYANRLSREMCDEWSKIQGRYIDLAVNAAGEEQVDLISRAIKGRRPPVKYERLSSLIASEIKRQRPAVSNYLPKTLRGCWPLHPIVVCLLGPISRRRFGQNQRSIFGFLNSAEPYGFQDFIRHHSEDAIFDPDCLWDYLRINLEPSILASPDGHRWALATEAIERCEALGGDALHLRLLKSIALLDLFKERSGLLPTIKLLLTCAGGASKRTTKDALDQLQNWSLIIFRKFAESFAIFAGSDFDVERTTQEALQNVREIDFAALQGLAGLQPILAKRHYHETGALRWFDVELAPLNSLVDRAHAYKPHAGTIGKFLLAIPTEAESTEQAQRICGEAALESKDWDVVVGLSKRSWAITSLTRELYALNEIQEEHPDLAGDPVAQREVQARHASLQGQVEEEVRRAFENATWYLKDSRSYQWHYAELNNIASDLAIERYPHSPRINNELLNRIKPSSNAVAARNALLRAMVTCEGKPRLGIEGYPAEGGLFSSLLQETGLYTKTGNRYRFCAPKKKNGGGLFKLWEVTTNLLRQADDRTVSVAEIYRHWSTPPFGLKEGLMPVIAVAFILSRREKIALYREGIFQSRFKDIDVEVLVRNADDIQLRWMDLSTLSRTLLSSMAEIVREIDPNNTLTHLEPIDVARGLIAIFDRLHPWTKRTMQLSTNATRIRDIFKHANDPNKFLFDDIPAAFGGECSLNNDYGLKSIIGVIQDGLEELVESYPSMLRRLNDLLLAELQVPNASPQALADLRARAKNIKKLGGDFHLDAFINRLSTFKGSTEAIESIASLAASKPPRDWTDPDLDRAAIEMTDFAQKFIRAETFARVKGRVDKRHAMAVVVGVNGRPTPLHAEFEVADGERAGIDEIITRVEGVIGASDENKRRLVLAALAEISSRYMSAPVESERSAS